MVESPREERRILVRWLRYLSGWDQSELGAAAGLSQGTISRYETAGAIPQGSLAKIVAALGLPLPWVSQRLLPVLRAGLERVQASTSAARLGSGIAAGVGEQLIAA